MSFLDPETGTRVEYVLAGRLSRTHAELLDTISNRELEMWRVLIGIEVEEAMPPEETSSQ